MSVSTYEALDVYFSPQSCIPVRVNVTSHIFFIVFDRRQIIRPTSVILMARTHSLFVGFELVLAL